MKEKQLKEALQRIKALNLHPNVAKELEKENKLNASEHMGALFWLKEGEEEVVRKIEDKYGILVYHCIRSHTEMGMMLSCLYVSSSEEEWEMERADLKEDRPIAYVYNASSPELSEFGSIEICPLFGGVFRVFQEKEENKMKRFEIIDNTGVVESGLCDIEEAKERLEELIEERFEFEGDIKIVEIHHLIGNNLEFEVRINWEN